jgi:hypothetical protein
MLCAFAVRMRDAQSLRCMGRPRASMGMSEKRVLPEGLAGRVIATAMKKQREQFLDLIFWGLHRAPKVAELRGHN